MSNSFRQKLPGYRGPGRNKGRPPRKSRGGQCPCCTEVKGKCLQNRIARARMAAETRELALEGEQAFRDERAEEGATWCSQAGCCGTCGECDHCTVDDFGAVGYGDQHGEVG